MTDYADVKYKRSTITLSGATESTPAEGDIWYQSGKFYFGTSQSMSNVWSTAGNLGTARGYNTGCGTQAAGLTFGGDGPLNKTEEYDGTVWSAGGNLGTARYGMAACGTQTAGLSMGGYQPPTLQVVTEEYNGTAWSAGGNIATARYHFG